MSKKRKTKEIRLENAKIARRQAYAENKADPELYDIIKEKEKERYKKRKEKKQILSITEKSVRDQRIQRKKWREAAKKYRQRKKELSKVPTITEITYVTSQEPLINENESFEITQNKLNEDPLVETKCNCTVKIKRLRMTELRKRIKMAKIIKAQKEEIERLKKKIGQHDQRNREITKSKMTKISKWKTLTVGKENVVKTDKMLPKLIEKFYIDDSNSVVAAGKKQYKTKNKVQKQKRYITSSLKILHQKFIDQTNMKVSYSTFCHYRPFWVLIPNNTQRDTCMCTIHTNIDLIVQALHKEDIVNEKNATELLTSQCCSIYNENCLMRNCDDCKNKVIRYNEFTNEETIKYFQWIRSKEKITTKKGPKTTTITKKEEFITTRLELINLLEKNLNSFMKHCYKIHIQYCTMKELRERLSVNEAILHVDFSENYALKCAQEVQSMHFGGSRKEICLHAAVYYTFDFQMSTTEAFSVCTVSECLRHDAPAIWAHLLPLISQTINQNPFVDTLHLQSDSPSSQYRNKYIFYLITKIHVDFPQISKITWNYMESGHGKGAPDGIGAVLKRTADAHVRYGSDVNNFYKFVTLLQKNVENVVVIPITEKEIKDKEKMIPNNLTTFKGTLGVHQVLWQKDIDTLTFRNASCFSCDVNIVCTHGRHLGFKKNLHFNNKSLEIEEDSVVLLGSTKNKDGMILKNILNQKIVETRGSASSIKILSNKKIVIHENEKQQQK